MIVFRYLLKEVSTTLIALTSILLLIFMSNQLVSYLNRAANGQIPGFFIVQLMLLELPTLLCLLLPLGFYMALLLAYGRLYADSEMTVLQACGFGEGQLLKHSLGMAVPMALMVLLIMLWLSPVIATERATLLRTAGLQVLIKTIMPGQFNVMGDGQQVFYVESMNKEHTVGRNIFLARSQPSGQWDILWADKAALFNDPTAKKDALFLEQGYAYRGVPGQADYQIAEFGRYKTWVPKPEVDISPDLRTLKTRDLWQEGSLTREKMAELQWRFSVPLMVLTLTFIAVPLSRLNPRSGKYAKLLPAILIYMIYANFMFVARGWVALGKVPTWLGVWWLHALMALLGLFLYWRHQVKPA